YLHGALHMLSCRRDLADQTEPKSGIRIEGLCGEQVASAYRAQSHGEPERRSPQRKDAARHLQLSELGSGRSDGTSDASINSIPNVLQRRWAAMTIGFGQGSPKKFQGS